MWSWSQCVWPNSGAERAQAKETGFPNNTRGARACILTVMADAFAMADESEVIANVSRAASRSVPNAADREDLAQETLLRVWQRDPAQLDGRDISAVRGLIRTILRRLRIDLWRRRRPPSFTRSDEATSPPEAIAKDELHALVRHAVEQLPSAQQEAVLLRYRDGMSFRAIAEAQGIPLNTALARVHAAIKRMRTELES